MRKSTRILAFCLVLLMTVGMLPLSLFAVGSGDSAWSVETKTDATTTPGASVMAGLSKSAISESITSYGGTLKGYETFDGWTLGKPGTSAPSGHDLGEWKNAAECFTVVDLGNGNNALQYGVGKSGASDYDTYFGAKLTTTAGQDFVLQADFKFDGGKVLVGTNGYVNLIMTGTRDTNIVKGSPTNTVLVLMDGQGNLYPANGNLGAITGEKIGNLNSDSFTTVAAYVDVSENKYYIYINGVNVKEAGYTWMSNDWITGKIREDVLDGGWTPNDYVNQFTRFYQIQNKSDKDVTFTVDNVLSYTTTRGYLGVKGDNKAATAGTNGLYKDPTTGYYCYLKNGSRVVNTTVDGIYFNAEGWASKAVRISAVNWDKSFDASSTDNLRNSINSRSTAKVYKSLSTPTYMIADVGFKYGARSATGFVPFSNDGKEWAKYDDIEYNFRTPSLQNYDCTLQIVVPDNDNPDAANKGKNYASYEIAFGDDIVGTYYALAKELGGDKTLGSTRNWNLKGLKAIGWTTYTKSLSSWGWRNAGFDWDDGTVNSIAFQFTGWNAAMNCTDAAGTQMAFNCGDAEIEIASINLVKYTPVTNLNEVIIEVNGDKVPVGGFITGWYEADSGNKYYFPAYSHELAKNKVCEIYDAESGKFLTYAFDATGKCTGLANGVAVCEDGNSRYFVNGEYKTANFTDEAGNKYEILPNGKITGDYFDVYSYDNAFANVPLHSGGTYTMAATFEDKSVGRADGTGPLITGNSSTIIAGTSAKPNATLIDKCGICEFVDVGGNNGKALKLYNVVNTVDTYINVNLPDISASLTENIIVEYEIMLGEDWNVDNFNFLQLIDRTNGIGFTAILQLNSDGYVRLACGGKNGTPLFKLSSKEFTRMSAVFHPTAKTMDIYCNGVCLIQNYAFTSGTINGTSFEVRFMQFQNQATHGTIYFDNFYFYSGETPEYVKTGVELRDGWITDTGKVTVNGAEETVSVTRYYQNGLMLGSNSTLNGPDGVSRTYYINSKDGCVTGTLGQERTVIATPADYSSAVATYQLSYNEPTMPVAAINTGAKAVSFNLPVRDISSYQYIAAEVYFDPSIIGAADYFQFDWGNPERYYKLNGGTYDESANTYTGYTTDYSTWLYSSSGLTKTATAFSGTRMVYYKTVDGKKEFYGHIWEYNQYQVKASAVTAGWNTIMIPISGTARQVTTFERWQIDVSGWSMSNSSKFLNEIDFRLGNVYLVKDVSIPSLSAVTSGVVNGFLYNNDVVATTAQGWVTIGEDDYYVKADTKVAIGVEYVDGKWYDFGTDGICKGLVNGSAEVINFNGKTAGTALKVFADGVLQFSDDDFIEIGGTKYLVENGSTGAIYSETEAVIEGTAYVADEKGAFTVNTAANGWYTLDGDKYYMTAGVATVDDVITVNGVKYYFDADGVLAVDSDESDDILKNIVTDGTIFTAGESGALTEFFGWYTDDEGDKYYNHSYYGLAEDLMKIDGKFYFFGTDNKLVKNGWATEYGMYFDANGNAADGIIENVIPMGETDPVDYMYFKSGVPCAYDAITDDNQYKVKFDENGMVVDINENKGVTIAIKKDGKTSKIPFVEATSGFTYVPTEFPCYSFVITTEEGEEIDSILVETLDKVYLFNVTYTAFEDEDHVWDEGIVKKEASCGVEGITLYTCATCGKTKTEAIEALTEHTYGEWSTLKSANCVNEGVKYRSCTGCGSIETEMIPTVGHVYDVDVTKPATCKEEGVLIEACTGCGKTKTTILPKLTTHTYAPGSEDIISESTCAVPGLALATCSVCGQSVTKELPLAEHADADLVPVTIYEEAETCLEFGHIYYQCKCCGAFIDDTAVQGPHNFDTTTYIKTPEGHCFKCITCEELGEVEAHDPVDATEAIPASCTAPGTTAGTKCSICDYVIVAPDVLDILSHEVDDTVWVTDENGHWHACANCTTQIDFAAHTFPAGDWTITANYHTKHCNICDKDIDIDHDWDMEHLTNVDLEEGTASGTCLTCATENTAIEIDTWWEPLGLIRSGEAGSYKYTLETPVLSSFVALGGTTAEFAGLYYFDDEGYLVMADDFALVSLIDHVATFYNDYGAIEAAWIIEAEDGNVYMINDGVIMTGTISCSGNGYYADETGALLNGYVVVDDVYRFYNVTTYALVRICASEIFILDGEEITTDEEGKATLEGFITIDGATFYRNAQGEFVTGLQVIGDDTYYFYSVGLMAKNAVVTVDNVTYEFGADGKALV